MMYNLYFKPIFMGKFLFLFFLLLNLNVNAAIPAANECPPLIYHAFNEEFKQIITRIPTLKRLGFTHIQLSPIQQSKAKTASDAWWSAYQPEGYVVEASCKYGSKQQLMQLLETASKNELKIIYDIVLTHSSTEYPFDNSFYDKHHPDPIGNLPMLNLSNQMLIKRQIDFLRYLSNLHPDSFGGFRVDAIGHIDATFHDIVLTQYRDNMIGSNLICYGELTGAYVPQHQKYNSLGFLTTDFGLLFKLRNAFSYEQDLNELIETENKNHLSRNLFTNAITCVRTHDHYVNKADGRGGIPHDKALHDDGDIMLANCFLLARTQGIPLILKQDIHKDNFPLIKRLTSFRRITYQNDGENDTQEFIHNTHNKNLLLMQRGNVGFIAINKSDKRTPITIRLQNADGSYIHNKTMLVYCGDAYGKCYNTFAKKIDDHIDYSIKFVEGLSDKSDIMVPARGVVLGINKDLVS